MPRLYFDITKYRRQQRHRSGLNRVSQCLQRSLPAVGNLDWEPVFWSPLYRSYLLAESRQPVGRGRPGDVFFTPEIFALKERLFSRRWMERFKGRKWGVFYDAIPWFHPETTWPRSVRRFPHWFRDLSAYDGIFPISAEAREQARKVQTAMGMSLPEGTILPLGADYVGQPERRLADSTGEPVFLNVGIIEPRKGQYRLLEACERLWREGLSFKMVFLGRVNPHFGLEIAARMEQLRGAGRNLLHEPEAGDDRLVYWHQHASLSVLPTRAEGFGLPALESLWAGCPVLATPQPSLNRFRNGSGVALLETADTDELCRRLRGFIKDPGSLISLEKEIRREALPLWSKAAEHLIHELRLSSKA